jgi:hypothetical protein
MFYQMQLGEKFMVSAEFRKTFISLGLKLSLRNISTGMEFLASLFSNTLP